ncbi:Vang-like protein 1 [Eufriesea mexicana]|uniref:vang-like protein 1 n=1 Tax=Eufriesea mexicana TaxID=516756 RepID=UPI00083C1CBE|nr:PREDICTED: vang-like protein 1 [Eufriesea mexicana]OAD58729.1 Vang-like protein 1 [Eufriesea mexicana]
METESVKSGASEHSHSHHSRTSQKHHRTHSSKSHHRQHSHRSTRTSRSQKKERHNLDSTEMAPFQTTVNLRGDSVDNLGQEVIEVQILPQDENWGENTTAVTGNTSDRSESTEDVGHWPNENDGSFSSCNRFMGPIIAMMLGLSAFLSPITMVILPKLGFFPDSTTVLTMQQKLQLLSCNAECKGQLLGLAFKLVLLGIGSWAVFLRSRNATMPRIFLFRAGVLLLTTLCICTYWLFYVVQVTESAKTAANGEITEYKNLVNYAGTLADTLLFIHYIAILLIEIRHQQPLFYLKVVRSPDGESRSYAIGQLSIQRAAVWVLEKYYTEFPIYNPYLERLPVSKSGRKQSSFKFYEVDGGVTGSVQSRGGSGDRAVITTQTRRRDSSHNERFYEEHDYERRVRKRRARLITAAEEAFTHIKRLHSEVESTPNPGPMDPMEAAQAVFPSMARALQKYLRVTRQQPRHSIESILNRLARCLAQDAAPRAFLEPFFVTSPVLSNEKERQKRSHHWALVCEGELPSRPLANGCEFQLRQGEVALLCTVYHLPHFHLTEQLAHPKSNKFLLRLNSETSV